MKTLILLCFFGLSVISCSAGNTKRYEQILKELVRDLKRQEGCSAGQFQCQSGQCIDAKYKCDILFDCEDKSDELSYANCTCYDWDFQCDDGYCIYDFFTCNGKPDCPDGSDESSSKCAPKECKEDEFRCAAGSCTSLANRCDGFLYSQDCNDGSDEEDCTKEECEANGLFHCKNNHCVDPRTKCDTYNDCGDNSDETPDAGCKCNSQQFTCDDGSCISKYSKCNGDSDCYDGSDEGRSDCPKDEAADGSSSSNGFGKSGWGKPGWGSGKRNEQVLMELLKDLEE